ncbi:MAG: VWA domain-containing protein [Bacillota bacterium]|nr:VWA domain-containing protein [Bacillota bacterium]
MNPQKKELNLLGRRLQAELARGAVRLGEAAVISRYAHFLDPRRPAQLKILPWDAGLVYLNLEEPGKALHIDVFHEPAALNPREVASALRSACVEYCRVRTAAAPGNHLTPSALLERLYLRTAQGEGWALSFLREGSGERGGERGKAHNHLHLLALLPPPWYDLVPYLVSAAEEVVAGGGWELRCVEELVSVSRSQGRFPLPLPLPRAGRSERGGEGLSRQVEVQTALELAGHLGGVEDALELLGALEPGRGRRSWAALARRFPDWKSILGDLAGAGLVQRSWLHWTLTPAGQHLYAFMRTYRRELEAQWRRVLRSVPRESLSYEQVVRSPRLSCWRTVSVRGKVVPLAPGSWPGELALPETIVEAARRLRAEGGGIRLQISDLRVRERRAKAPLEICLLVDASASMAGKRLRAAARLGQHLLLATRARLAIMAFQGKEARVVVPFTRSQARLVAGLRSLEAGGLTPLAKALASAVQMLQRARAKNPLLILLTDGLPTVPAQTADPLQDALAAAEKVAEQKIGFVCLGLEPDREFLQELALRAGGSLLVFADLEGEALIRAIHQEKRLLTS